MNVLKEFWKEEDAVGVVEIILILVARLALSMSIWFKSPFYLVL